MRCFAFFGKYRFLIVSIVRYCAMYLFVRTLEIAGLSNVIVSHRVGFRYLCYVGFVLMITINTSISSTTKQMLCEAKLKLNMFALIIIQI